MKKQAVLSLSGGMDSGTLLLHLLTKSSTKIDQIEETIDTEKLYNINHNLIQFKQFIQDGNTQLY